MNDVTRSKRPTYATPRANPPGRFFHVSTDYQWLALVPGLPARFVRVAPGRTYRRPTP